MRATSSTTENLNRPTPKRASALRRLASVCAGVAAALRNFDPRVIKRAGELAKQLIEVLAAQYGAARAYLGGPGVSISGAVSFTFSGGTLGPGERTVLASNLGAYLTRYASAPMPAGAPWSFRQCRMHRARTRMLLGRIKFAPAADPDLLLRMTHDVEPAAAQHRLECLAINHQQPRPRLAPHIHTPAAARIVDQQVA